VRTFSAPVAMTVCEKSFRVAIVLKNYKVSPPPQSAQRPRAFELPPRFFPVNHKWPFSIRGFIGRSLRTPFTIPFPTNTTNGIECAGTASMGPAIITSPTKLRDGWVSLSNKRSSSRLTSVMAVAQRRLGVAGASTLRWGSRHWRG